MIYKAINIKKVIQKVEKPHVKKDPGKIKFIAIERFVPDGSFDRFINTCYKLKQEGIDDITLSIVGTRYLTFWEALINQVKKIMVEGRYRQTPRIQKKIFLPKRSRYFHDVLPP